MAHVSISNDLPGIAGLFEQFTDTATPLRLLAETLLRGPSPLTPFEREAIATHVSAQNDCYFCSHSHAAAAGRLPHEEKTIIGDLLAKRQPAELGDRFAALLTIAEQVRRDARGVTDADIERARHFGWDDRAIHDTVLIAAAFCMYNRYVDGLATSQPRDAAVYDVIGEMLATQGYLRSDDVM
jgi:uncharacterized peroxidase-related enzyme